MSCVGQWVSSIPVEEWARHRISESFRGRIAGELRVLLPLSKLCLLDQACVSCITVFLLLAEAEKKKGSGNLTCVCSVRISCIQDGVFKPIPP